MKKMSFLFQITESMMKYPKDITKIQHIKVANVPILRKSLKDNHDSLLGFCKEFALILGKEDIGKAIPAEHMNAMII